MLAWYQYKKKDISLSNMTYNENTEYSIASEATFKVLLVASLMSGIIGWRVNTIFIYWITDTRSPFLRKRAPTL